MERSRDFTGIIKFQNVPIGVDFGFYPCHEHEWGIENILRNFGIGRPSRLDLKSWRMTTLPNDLYVGEYKKDKYIIFYPGLGEEPKYENGSIVYEQVSIDKRVARLQYLLENKLPLPYQEGAELVAAWDSGSFGLRARREGDVDIVYKLEDAFLKNDVCIVGRERSNEIKTSGMGLLIYSLIPKNLREKHSF